VLVVVLVLAACGGSSPPSTGTTQAAQPDQDGGFESSAFANIPTPGGAQAFGPPTEQGDAFVQSFETVGLGSSETMQFYEDTLDNTWTEVSPPQVLGHCEVLDVTEDGCTYRAVWSTSTLNLQVTAGPDGTDADGNDGAQLDLVLTGTQ
jgi:hypothetical protein